MQQESLCAFVEPVETKCKFIERQNISYSESDSGHQVLATRNFDRVSAHMHINHTIPFPLCANEEMASTIHLHALLDHHAFL
jgi:hypothetical protein